MKSKRTEFSITQPPLHETTHQKTSVHDWWIYKTSGPGIHQAENYFAHPACDYAEYYYALFIHGLRNLLKSSKLPQQYIVSTLVLSYDQKLTLPATALRKTNLHVSSGLFRETRHYTYGEETYLLLNTHLAGTICEYSPWSTTARTLAPQMKAIPTRAIRPLSFNASWISEIFMNELKNKHNTLQSHELDQIEATLNYIQKHGFIEGITQLLTELNLPICADTVLQNSQLPKINIAKYKKQKQLSRALVQ